MERLQWAILQQPSCNLETGLPRLATFALTTLAMLAFAGNSLLCRAALEHTSIDPTSFTVIRIVSGTIALWLIATLKGHAVARSGNWISALMLSAYAFGFAYAYVHLNAATGALLLFGAVQATMIGYGLATGERLAGRQWLGLITALLGLTGLLLPGLTAPPFGGAALMLGAGVGWGVYSLRGKGAQHAIAATAGNFLRATPIALVAGLMVLSKTNLDWYGVTYAIASGALTSGVGYAIWFNALQGLRAVSAATVQLSVPIIAAVGGVLLLGEAISARLLLASIAVIGGIALVILSQRETAH